VLFIRAAGLLLQKIAELPFISFSGLQSLKDQALNNNNRAASRGGRPPKSAGKNLQGDGVTVGWAMIPTLYACGFYRQADRTVLRRRSGAHGNPYFGDRWRRRILDPRYKGMAPHATIVSSISVISW